MASLPVDLVNNNRSLSQDKAPFEMGWHGEQTEARDRMWMFEDVDSAQVARSFGCEDVRVEDPSQLDAALRDALGSSRPVVLDVVTDLDALPDPPPRWARLLPPARSRALISNRTGASLRPSGGHERPGSGHRWT
jgi:TPP-dependent trihydroxycyclohexane-1,2-dione (THcHDO) dehydratase